MTVENGSPKDGLERKPLGTAGIVAWDAGTDMTSVAHPYIPNSAPAARQAMLATIGVADEEELLAAVPEGLRSPPDLAFPEALEAEGDLERYFVEVLALNGVPTLSRCFLGGGCWPHLVPAVCDEIARRREFLTAMLGFSPQTSPGAYQALFEYQSMLCELVGMDATAVPTMTGAQPRPQRCESPPISPGATASWSPGTRVRSGAGRSAPCCPLG